jgi:hypothetical protein
MSQPATVGRIGKQRTYNNEISLCKEMKVSLLYLVDRYSSAHAGVIAVMRLLENCILLY